VRGDLRAARGLALRLARCLPLVVLVVACDRSDHSSRFQRDTTGDPIPGAPTTGQVQFHYGPPDGKEFVQTRFTRVKMTSASEPVVTRASEETEERVAVTIRETGDGYLMTERTLSVHSWSNGSAYNNPYLKLKVGEDLTYHLDSDGKVVSVDGLDALADRARGVAAAQGRRLLEDRTLLEQAKEFWNERVGAFTGTNVSLGGTAEIASPRTLLNGKTISLPQSVSVPRFAACPAGRCVMVWSDSSSSDSALIEFTVELLAQGPCAALMRQKKVKLNVRATFAGTAASASRVIDPDTMLIYKDSGTETTSATLEVSGEAEPVRFIREWEYTVDPVRSARTL
jgi:hypothetical protein